MQASSFVVGAAAVHSIFVQVEYNIKKKKSFL